MNHLLANLWMLADEAAQPVKEAADKAGNDGFNPMMPAFIAIGVVFLMMMFQGPKKEQRKREEMLKSLKKNDKVITQSGIIGTFVAISNDLREVTLKLEDSTRIKFVSYAIAGLYSGADGENKDGDKDSK